MHDEKMKLPNDITDALQSHYHAGERPSEGELATSRRIAAQVYNATGWIGETFSTLERDRYRHIIVLGPNTGEELLHLRTQQAKARISAFEIDPKPISVSIYDVTNTRGYIGPTEGDFRKIEKAFQAVGQFDLLVCRAPRVIETTDAQKRIIYNDDIVGALVGWVENAREQGAHVFITTLTREEAIRILIALKKKLSIRADATKNPHTVPVLKIELATNNGTIVGMPDQYIIKLV